MAGYGRAAGRGTMRGACIASSTAKTAHLLMRKMGSFRCRRGYTCTSHRPAALPWLYSYTALLYTKQHYAKKKYGAPVMSPTTKTLAVWPVGPYYSCPQAHRPSHPTDRPHPRSNWAAAPSTPHLPAVAGPRRPPRTPSLAASRRARLPTLGVPCRRCRRRCRCRCPRPPAAPPCE
eukprot:scaffold41408_cov66-Phaeocystis_antarctica.AAC.3